MTLLCIVLVENVWYYTYNQCQLFYSSHLCMKTVADVWSCNERFKNDINELDKLQASIIRDGLVFYTSCKISQCYAYIEDTKLKYHSINTSIIDHSDRSSTIAAYDALQWDSLSFG